MKRVCAMICLTMLIVAQTLNINVKASVIVPEIPLDPGLISGLGDLGYGLAGGASFDFTGSKWAELEQELENGGTTRTEALQQASLAFLQDYSMRRGVPYAEQLPDMPVTAKDYYYTNYYNSAVRKNWELYQLGVANENQANIDRALLFPLSPDRFADWTNYNQFWYEKYIKSLEVREEDNPVEIPTWANIYLDHLSVIWMQANNENSKRDFLNVPVKNGAYGEAFFWNNRTDYSYVRIEQNNGAWIPIVPIDIFVNTNQNGGYDMTTSTLTYYNTGVAGYVYRNNTNYFPSFYPQNYDANGIWIGNGSGRTSLVETNAHFDSLQAAFVYIDNFFVYPKSITVDGDIWLGVGGQAPANPVIPDFPDVIGGTSEDTLPAYDIVFPGTADHSGYFDITALFDEIMIAISGATDDDDSTDATLDKDAIKENLKDEELEDVPDDVIPSDDVIDEPLEGEATMRLPEIPIYPAPAINALAGTTILASYIDAMNQLLPNNIIVVFWGIVWVLLIVAIIKSMHR